MNSYYLTLVVKSDLEDKEREELLDSITKKFDKVTKTDLWGNKDLSYPLKKQTKGYYAHYALEADPAKISGIDSSLKLEEDILRYLLIRA